MANEARVAVPECFVCTESDPAPFKSACLCTDRHVHADCLVKLLKQRAQPTCPVCLAPYGNVHFCDHRRCNPCSPGVGICCLSCAFIALTSCACSTLYTLMKRGDALSENFRVLLAASGTCMLVLSACTLAILAQLVYRVDNRAVVSECFVTKRVYHVYELEA